MLVPSSEAQSRAMSAALRIAGLDAADVSMLECHATGTSVGDATEIRSSAAVYGDCEDLPIGSLKSNTGHLITAAGVAGLIKVLEAMRHEVRPPTIHVDEPLADIEASPFRLLTEAEPWDRTTIRDGVLRAGVSAFGFGGNNAHLLVEEPAIGQHNGSTTGAPALGCADRDRRHRHQRGVCGRTAGVHRRASEQCFVPRRGRVRDDATDLSRPGRAEVPAQRSRQDVGPATRHVAGHPRSGRRHRDAPRESTGVYVGMGTDAEAARFGIRWRLATRGVAWGQSDEWIADAREHVGPVLDAPAVLGTMPNIVANRLNRQFDFAGPSFTVSSEEHSGLDALSIATRALDTRELDAAIVGAVDLSCEPVHRRRQRAVSTTTARRRAMRPWRSC